MVLIVVVVVIVIVGTERCTQLVISYRMSAEYMCEFTSEEFCSGLEEIGVDSIEGLKAKLPALRNLMKDECTYEACNTEACV